MKARSEKLGDRAAVKATMLQAHLTWAEERLGGALVTRLGPKLPDASKRLVSEPLLATEWIPFRSLIELDRAIASAAGGDPEQVYQALGRHSATRNLSGVYRNFVPDEPHRFFEQMALLHGRFQNFGRSTYEKAGDHAGRIRVEGYDEYSPVFCASGNGYYEGALQMMKVPGPISAVETACQCAGDPACVYDLGW